MHKTNDNYKKILFDKEAHETLTPDEQEIIDEIIASEQPQQVNIDLNDPVFMTALKLFLNIRKDAISSWEKFEKEVLQKRSRHDNIE